MASPRPQTGRMSLTFRLILPFIAMVLLQAALAGCSIYMLYAVRAFVAGESQWTKGQKDAIYFLEAYAISGDAHELAQFRAAIAIPLGDRLARLAVEQAVPDLAEARRGLLLGRNHPDDVESLLWLFLNFRQFDLVRQPVEMWLVGDRYLGEMQQLAGEIQSRVAAGPVDGATVHRWRGRIRVIDAGVSPAASAFNNALGQSSRRIVHLLLWSNLALAGVLIVLAGWHTRSLLAQGQRFATALGAEKARAEITLAAIGDGVVTTDAQGRILYLNAAAESLLAVHASCPIGQLLSDVLKLETDDGQHDIRSLIQRLLRGETPAHDDRTRRLLRPDRTAVPVKLVGSTIYGDGQLTGTVLVMHDMTQEQHYLKQLAWQASHDPLTGLANRREFERRLALRLARPPEPRLESALLYLDLDQFKIVNDTCGHQAGDKLLREVCSMIHQGLRDGDTLARLGGDEFGILLEDCPPALAERIAEQLRLSAQNLRVVWGDRLLATGLSIGVVQLRPALGHLQDLLRAADMACYRAKERGRNRIHVHRADDADLSQQIDDMDWMQRLRSALEQNHFCLYAQEIAPLRPRAGDNGLHIELLLRLNDPMAQGGTHPKPVTPEQFIPAAERYGLMPAIDRWVVSHAFATLAMLAKQPDTAGLRRITTCAINLSGTSLGDESLLDFLRRQLAWHGIAPHTVCFEVTETSAIAHLPSAIHLIAELRQLGCHFSLDDFGSGMSSFNYLKHLPVDYLKIDGGFVREMMTDPADRAMVEMINHIGHVMGKTTIAEFAEDQAVVEALRTMGVDYAQGYAIAEPHPFTLEAMRASAQASALADAGPA